MPEILAMVGNLFGGIYTGELDKHLVHHSAEEGKKILRSLPVSLEGKFLLVPENGDQFDLDLPAVAISDVSDEGGKRIQLVKRTFFSFLTPAKYHLKHESQEHKTQDQKGLFGLPDPCLCHCTQSHHTVSVIHLSNTIIKLVRFFAPIIHTGRLFKNLTLLMVNNLLLISSLHFICGQFISMFLCQHFPLI